MTWARSYPGEIASGVPPIIPTAWAEGYYGHYALEKPDRWPSGNWERAVAHRFRCDWKNGNAKARGEFENKNAPPEFLRLATDPESWWADSYDSLSMELAGWALGETQPCLLKRDRIRDILKIRFPNK